MTRPVFQPGFFLPARCARRACCREIIFFPRVIQSATVSEFQGIPVVTSGSKYETEQGFKAIKDGVKQRADRRDVRLRER